MRVRLVISFGFPKVFGSKAELRQEEGEGTQTLEGSVGRKMAATDRARPKCVTNFFCPSSLVCTQTLEGRKLAATGIDRVTRLASTLPYGCIMAQISQPVCFFA